jgi:hypothetical protein
VVTAGAATSVWLSENRQQSQERLYSRLNALDLLPSWLTTVRFVVFVVSLTQAPTVRLWSVRTGVLPVSVVLRPVSGPAVAANWLVPLKLSALPALPRPATQVAPVIVAVSGCAV